MMSGDSHTLLINAGGEVQLLLDLSQPVLGGDGVIVGVVEGRGLSLRKPSNFLWKKFGCPPWRWRIPLARVSRRRVWRSITSASCGSGGGGGASSPSAAAPTPPLG
jgi:hypothetical protein